MTAHPMRILVVDDEEAMREVLQMRLEGWGHEVLLAGDAEAAHDLIRRHGPDLVISDVVLPGATGVELLATLKEGEPARPVILITAHGSIDDAVEAMKRGADDFLTKPLDYGYLRSLLDEMEERLSEIRRQRDLRSTLDSELGVDGMVGASDAMQQVFELVKRVAGSDASVLVTGESGTGKELVARAIHDLGRRRGGPFVAVNAAAFPEGVIESELFGHERGAFTGAERQRQGCFERADGGTLFLDEITEMPIALQPKLLRVLEAQSVRRVGGARDIPFSVRLVTATNRDPVEAIREGKMREDLYYRLAVFPLQLPPLRERGEDIDLLAQHFVELFSRKHDCEVLGLTEGALGRLRAYDWPGNVRELRNLIERGVILARQGWLDEGHLPPVLRPRLRRTGEGVLVPPDTTVADAERMLILDTLQRVGDNKAEAARRLGVDVKTIRNKLKRYEDEPTGA